MCRTIIVAISTAITLATLSGAQAFTPRNLTGPVVESDNGQRYQIEDITRREGGFVELNIYVHGAPGDIMAPERMMFDCRGHMYNGAWAYVPPRSVAGRIAQIACSKAR
jgi:hypothetical protein